MKTISALIILIILSAIILFGYAYSGLYDVAVGTSHNSAVAWYLETVRERSIEVRAEKLEVPKNLDDAARILAGAGHYEDMCAACHGYPGQPPADVWEPAPPALAKDAPPPAEAFWAIRNGIKMTAMPKHMDHSEEDIWDIVAFLKKLPSLSPTQYQTIMASAEHTHAPGSGHSHEHGSEHGHEHENAGHHAEDGDAGHSHGGEAPEGGHNHTGAHHSD